MWSVSLCVALAGCGSPPGPAETFTSVTSAVADPGPSVSTSTRPSIVNLDVIAGRAAHTATTLADGRVLVAGGCIVDGCGAATAETFLVDSQGATGSAGPSMSAARDSHTATLVAGAVFLIGGFAGEGRPPLSSIDVFWEGTGRLDPFATLHTGRGGHASAIAGNGTIVVVGGWVRPRTYASSVEIVDPNSGKVRHGPDLPWAADALDAVTLSDGRILVTGGQVQPGMATDAAALFDPSTDTWQSLGPMLTPRLKHTSVLLSDGRVLIIGGTSDDVTLLATTEVFDPSTLTFAAGPGLHEGRYKMPGGALALSGGQVLIAGGGSSVELLDTRTNDSRVIAEFGTRGSFATISRLGDGSWVVIGGYDDRIRLTRVFLRLAPEDLEGPGG
jgi:hypothetical protein